MDGILGTGLFSRLPATLDYRERHLRMGPSERLTRGTPFYLAGDQYPLVDARVNNRLDTLLFLDTGMIGDGFVNTGALTLDFRTMHLALELWRTKHTDPCQPDLMRRRRIFRLDETLAERYLEGLTVCA